MEDMFNPKVSIIIPAYNASNYLEEAINSALAQTYKNVEIIVVNDGSEDDGETERIALSYGDKIRYMHKRNGGSSSALNMGIANMTGEWFSWLSHDDLYFPEKIERQIEYLKSLNEKAKNLSKHILFSASELIDKRGVIIRPCNVKRAQQINSQINSFQHNGYLVSMPTRYIFHGCSCLIHKEAFLEVGNFDESLRLLNDADMWFRLYTAGFKVHYIPMALVKGRIHQKQVSKSIGYSYHNTEQDMYWNRCLDWLIEKYPYDDELFFRYAINAYFKTRNIEGDKALAHIKRKYIIKFIISVCCKICALVLTNVKKLYLKTKM